LEDDLMRLFGGERITAVMNTLKTPEDMPIEAKMISNTIESAQKKIEGRNFGIRKNVLQYDDVMNRQRELIYKQRNQVLDGEELKPVITRMIENSINDAVDMFCSDQASKKDWNIDGLKDKFKSWGLIEEGDFEDTTDKEEIRETLLERAEKRYAEREELFGETDKGDSVMRELEKMVLLRNVDNRWMDHIDAMDQLRRGIGLRAYGQTDPVVAYRQVGSDMFDGMNEEIREDTARQILTVMIRNKEETKREQTAKITGTSGASDGTEKGRTVRKKENVGPNDPCPCGSGKKYKKCCGDVSKNSAN
ncbi:MAG: SEC-C domain-containing protein, partial [Clostridia bacterium]|nr:SEC-C domain-containing protein [Clostridia bacterium]